ncbi:MAG TPA: hypothetical protein VN682_25765 [Terriglobales bacterium]|nr:hypothetical protein [Terriglobales bacterium]
MYAPVDNRKTQSFVNMLGNDLIDPSVGGHFDASVPPRPIFGCLEELSANALSPIVILHEPTFDKTYRMCRVAAVCMRTQSYFEETD